MYGLCLVYRYTCCKYVWYRYIWILHLCTGCVWVCMYGICILYRYTCRTYVWYSYIRILHPWTRCWCEYACMACVYHTGTPVRCIHDIGIYGFCALAQGVWVSVHVWLMYSIQVHILQICMVQVYMDSAPLHRVCVSVHVWLMFSIQVHMSNICMIQLYTNSAPLHRVCVWVCMYGMCISYRYTCWIYVWYRYIWILRPCTGCVCECACMAYV